MLPMGTELFADRWSDGLTDMIKLMVASGTCFATVGRTNWYSGFQCHTATLPHYHTVAIVHIGESEKGIP
jgi:hypothetical protein